MNSDDDKTHTHVNLTKGTMVGHYRIVEKIGAGGMGEVYLAEDTELDRKVALKFLLPYLCQDGEGRARFKREAQAAAALSHPNIVTVYEVSEHEGRPYIAMEYLQGESLRDVLSEKDVRIERIIDLIAEVCDGLAAAHRAGIVHRDMKPSNICVTPGDTAKILDFGLAISECFEQITRTGSTLGTVDYMSPEQARGDDIDRRSDLFSVGVMLYELITGNKPFRRDNQIATLQAIVNDEPEPLARYKAAVPAELQRIISKLVSKKPAERYQHADDVAVDLRAIDMQAPSIASYPHQPKATARRRSLGSSIIPWVVAAVAILVVVWQLFKPSQVRIQQTMHFPVAIPDEYRMSERNVNKVAVSPDGTRWVTRVTDSMSVRYALLWEAGSRHPSLLPGTNGCSGLSFSPDGNWLCFHAGGKLKKLHLAGGDPVEICGASSVGSFWSLEDTIFFCQDYSGIWKVSANGGEPEQVTSIGPGEFAHWAPEVLPNGRAMLFTIWNTSLRDICTGILDFGSGHYRVLIKDGAHARWVPTGHLVYIRRGTLMAIPFDLEKLEITGSEVPVIADIHQVHDVGLGSYSFSRDGFLAYWSSANEQKGHRVIWIDQQGKILSQEKIEGAGYADQSRVSLSPDENYLAYDRLQDGILNIWLLELATGRSRQLTLKSENMGAVWSPDGMKIAFTTYRHGPFSVYEIPVDLTKPEYPLIVRNIDVMVQCYTPDGKRLLYTAINPKTDFDIEVLSLEDTTQTYPLVAAPYRQELAASHPDGEWVAYTSRRPDRDEIYIRHISGTGVNTQVTVDGGTAPIWSQDGATLYYLNKDRMTAVSVETEPQLRIGRPRVLFEIADVISYDVASDGRFIVTQRTSSDQQQLVVVTNWFEELKELSQSAK
jgi:serine/threonine protein kinase/Tol biopolymer transport system component